MLHRRSAMLAPLLLPGIARAQGDAAEWRPTQPMRIVAPAAPGGTTDIMARMLAQHLQSRFGINAVADNRSGGGGTIGTMDVLRAPADGLTLLSGNIGPQAIAYSLFRNLQYRPESLAPVGNMIRGPNALLLHPSIPARTVPEFVAHLKANPGKYTYGSSGPRTSPHLGAALFCDSAGVEMVHVPYRGTGPAAQALLSGEISMVVDSITTQRGFMQAGRSRPLAMLGRTRSALLPDVPTLAESGLAGFDFNFWAALFGPAGLPAEIALRQAEAIGQAIREPGLAARLVDLGVEAKASSPAELDRFFRHELQATREIVRRAGIELE